jgi:hypothetical protein
MLGFAIHTITNSKHPVEVLAQHENYAMVRRPGHPPVIALLDELQRVGDMEGFTMMANAKPSGMWLPQGKSVSIGAENPGDKLEVSMDESGDISLVIRGFNRPNHTVRFCTFQGGGMAIHTRQALIHLMMAMRMDLGIEGAE